MMQDTNLDYHRELLASFAKRMRPQCYLELGLNQSPALLTLWENCYHCLGVDIHRPTWDVPQNTEVFVMRTNEFFEKHRHRIPPVELAFIDADHDCQQVQTDLLNTVGVMAENGVIVMHDTFPACSDDIARDRSGTAFVTAEWACKELEAITLPFPPGLTIIRVKPTSLLGERE